MKTKAILTLVLFMMGITSCNFIDDIFNKKEENPSFVADISSETDYDFLVYSGIDDSYIAVRQNNGKPVEALVKPNKGGDPYPVWFNSDGLVEKIVINSHILLFSNYNAGKFDLAVISPVGELTTVREILIPEKDSQYLQLKSASTGDILIWTGHAIGIATCVSSLITGVAATATTLGIGTPAAAALIALGCGSTAIGLATEIIGNEKIADFLNLPLKTVKGFTTTVNCVLGKPLSCFASVSGLSLSVAGGVLREHEKEVQLAEGVLEGGYGDIQVTLTWDSSADIDLYVQDPAKEWIWYEHNTSVSGGWLDVDDVNGYGPENIRWGKGVATSGTYNVHVKHYEGGSANYIVYVNAFGRQKQYKGSINPGQEIYITDFSKTYLKNAFLPKSDVVLPWAAK
ncbi:MAG: hypothetical protein JZU47_10255 [Prolixibacteraceae bacterium]|nr:hypothetical protein [Prolixibacteraceae bacterium]